MTSDACKHVIDHKMPTGDEMRAEMQRKLDAGEPLGASHVHHVVDSVSAIGTISGNEYRKLSPSDKPNWGGCRPPIEYSKGSLTRKGNPK